MYTAWRCVVDRPNCEREFALEGVTHLEGAPHGEYIHHIPGSLAIESSKLEFWRHVQSERTNNSMLTLTERGKLRFDNGLAESG